MCCRYAVYTVLAEYVDTSAYLKYVIKEYFYLVVFYIVVITTIFEVYLEHHIYI